MLTRCEKRPHKDACDREWNNCTMRECSKWPNLRFACEFSALGFQQAMRGQTAQEAFNAARSKCCKPQTE